MKKTTIAVLLVLCLLVPTLRAHEEHEGHEDHHDDEHHPDSPPEDDHEAESASGEEEEDEENPHVAFQNDSELEHMRNFQAISGDLKAYEDEYLDCVKEIEDAEFSEDRIDKCVGHNFLKVLVDIKYVSMKTMSQGDSKVRDIFVRECYQHAFEDEEFLAACEVMEGDVLKMLWTGLAFPEILEINSDKYIYEYGKMPLNVFEQIFAKLNKFAKEFFELIDEIDAHKEVTIIRLKNYIDDRIKLIAEAEGMLPDIMPEEHEDGEGHHGDGEHGETRTHTVEVTEHTDVEDDEEEEHGHGHHKRKLLPALQINRSGNQANQNRYVNARAEHANDNKKLYDKPQTPGAYLFSRMNEQKQNQAKFGGGRPVKSMEEVRQALRNTNFRSFGKFKAK